VTGIAGRNVMAGIDDVAQLARVSTATVSRALSGNGQVSATTRQRVHEAAQQLGYVVSSSASGLASGRTRNVGVVVPFLNRWFHGAVIEGAEHALLARGYDLTLYNLGGGSGERHAVFEHFLLRKRVDAVLAIALELTDAEVGRLHDLGKPIVGIGGTIRGVRTLSIDDHAVARLATEHLIGLGHRRIAHIGGDAEHELDFHVPSTRRVGYEHALTDAGIPVDPALFEAGDFTLPGGYAAAARLLGSAGPRPTAVFAASDEMAIGAMLAARDLGLSVPHDLAVVGVDDHELAEFFGLTTVAQFPALQGSLAVDMLMGMLGDPERDEAATIPLPYELIVRSSTASPAQGAASA
jgi:LacI family transcriptional regulator, repressor for deo operon, udp, cdd, tsx, nupC, and nupG